MRFGETVYSRPAASLPDAVAVTVDTADPAAVERAVATAVEHYGRIDVIFNNAGVEGRQQPLHEMELDNWERVTAVDRSGVFHVLKYGIAAMLTTGGGVVINTSSTAGLIGQENISPYSSRRPGSSGSRGLRPSSTPPTGSASTPSRRPS
jgi:NAD(P)-dependent dehydrogenase (short-subunit alcohol dehydrogenase family)